MLRDGAQCYDNKLLCLQQAASALTLQETPHRRTGMRRDRVPFATVVRHEKGAACTEHWCALAQRIVVMTGYEVRQSTRGWDKGCTTVGFCRARGIAFACHARVSMNQPCYHSTRHIACYAPYPGHGPSDLEETTARNRFLDELTLALSISCLFTASCPSSAFRFCFFFCFSSEACSRASFEGEGGPSCQSEPQVVSERGLE